jgi:hypothetical protein
VTVPRPDRRAWRSTGRRAGRLRRAWPLTFLSGQHTLVTETESEVWPPFAATTKLEGTDGVVQFVN